MKHLIRKRFKNWRYYLLELLVVFVGVTGAFLLNTCRENRIATTQAQHYLESIKSDLGEDRENLKENIAFLQENNRMLGKFLYNQGSDWVRDSTMTVLANSMQLVAFSGKSSTYESMKYSGHLTLISDFETRTAIVSYYESFATIALKDGLAQEWTTGKIVEMLLEKMDMRRGVLIDDSIFDELFFLNRYSGLLVLLDQNLKAYIDLLEKNESLLELLES